MIQRDYILRMIEEIGKFISRLSGLKDKKLYDRGFEELLAFLEAHYNLKEADLLIRNMEALEGQLKTSFENYPDELGQFLSDGAEMAREAGKDENADTLYLLAWKALREAESKGQAFRFDRVVEINAIKEKLSLMGIFVGDNDE